VYRIYSASNLQEAHLLAGLLRQQGIEAHVFNENAIGGMGEIPFTQAWPEIWLEDERDRGRAEEVIRRFEQQAEAGLPSVRCPVCGEENPGGFEICWHCGAVLKDE
jgi:hypothetical protein